MSNPHLPEIPPQICRHIVTNGQWVIPTSERPGNWRKIRLAKPREIEQPTPEPIAAVEPEPPARIRVKYVVPEVPPTHCQGPRCLNPLARPASGLTVLYCCKSCKRRAMHWRAKAAKKRAMEVGA